MNERGVIYLLSGAFLAVLIWRMIPTGGAVIPADAAADQTMGQPPAVPTLPAELIIGQSLDPEDGGAGPTWYCAAYPGDRPGMPAIPSALQ